MSEENMTASSLQEVVDALVLLGLDGDKIFARIREDLDRGDKTGARTHLNFVDVMLERKGKISPDEGRG